MPLAAAELLHLRFDFGRVGVPGGDRWIEIRQVPAVGRSLCDGGQGLSPGQQCEQGNTHEGISQANSNERQCTSGSSRDAWDQQVNATRPAIRMITRGRWVSMARSRRESPMRNAEPGFALGAAPMSLSRRVLLIAALCFAGLAGAQPR